MSTDDAQSPGAAAPSPVGPLVPAAEGAHQSRQELAGRLARLAAAADVVPALGPAAARAIGARRRRTRAIGAVIAAAVVVTGLLSVGSVLRRAAAVPRGGVIVTATGAGNPTHPGGTGPSAAAASPTEPSPTVADYPTASPVPAPPGCDENYYLPGPAIGYAGTALPAAVLLAATDLDKCWWASGDTPGYTVYGGPDGEWARPDPCLDHAGYPADQHRLAGRSRRFQAGPVASAYESVTRYAPGQAAAFLAQVRDRVAGCASFQAPGTSGLSGPLHATIVAQGFAGTESLLVCTAAACVPGSYPAFYVAVVRIGDYVLVFDHGFDLGGDPAFGKAAAVRAAGRLTAAVGG